MKIAAKLILMVITLMLAVAGSQAQDSLTVRKDTTATFSRGWEIHPRYPGGEEAMRAFITANLNIAEQQRLDSISGKAHGRVTTRFRVTEDGSLDGIAVLRGIDPWCDEEALRVIRLMPKWTPGTAQNGKTISVYFTLPIVFSPKK